MIELVGVGQDVTWFTDKPARDAGAVPLSQLVSAGMSVGPTDDPPNSSVELVVDHGISSYGAELVTTTTIIGGIVVQGSLA